MGLPKPYHETDLGRLYCADALEILPHLETVDLVLTDPPYGIGISMNPFRQKHEKSEWDNQIPNVHIFDLMFEKSDQQIIWGGNFFPLPPPQGFLIWDKVQPEDFSSSMCEFAWMSIKQPAKLFRRHVVSFSKLHPTQKPTELMMWCLKFYRGNIGTVLDPFSGSGTTAVACERLKRRWIGIEIEEKYCQIAVKRIEAERKQIKLF